MSPEVTYVVESLATIAVFGGALWVATWGVRRLTGPAGRGPLEILARQPLDARRAIYLVRVGKRVLIVGASEGALTRLGSTSLEAIQDELAAASGAGAEPGDPVRQRSKTFRDALTRALGRDKH